MTTKELADLSFKACEPACHKGMRLLFFVAPDVPVIGLDAARFVAAIAKVQSYVAAGALYLRADEQRGGLLQAHDLRHRF